MKPTSVNECGLPSITSMLPASANDSLSAVIPRTKEVDDEPHARSMSAMVEVEERRLQQEQHRTRQETLKLDQRIVEQSMLREAMGAGVPPHLIPLMFAGGAANIQAYAALLNLTLQDQDPLPSESCQQSKISSQPSTSIPCPNQVHASDVRTQSVSYSPPMLAKGRANASMNMPQMSSKYRSYSVADGGSYPIASEMAPPEIRLNHNRRVSPLAHEPTSCEQSTGASWSPFSQHLPPMHNAMRSFSVSDAEHRAPAPPKADYTHRKSVAPYQKPLNFCHWKPPPEPSSKGFSKAFKGASQTAQQKAANESTNDSTVTSGTNKRKAEDDSYTSQQSNYSNGHDLSYKTPRTSSELQGFSHERKSPGDETKSLGMPRHDGARLRVNSLLQHDSTRRASTSRPSVSPTGGSGNRKRQDKTPASHGTMNLCFVNGLETKRGLSSSLSQVRS